MEVESSGQAVVVEGTVSSATKIDRWLTVYRVSKRKIVGSWTLKATSTLDRRTRGLRYRKWKIFRNILPETCNSVLWKRSTTLQGDSAACWVIGYVHNGHNSTLANKFSSLIGYDDGRNSRTKLYFNGTIRDKIRGFLVRHDSMCFGDARATVLQFKQNTSNYLQRCCGLNKNVIYRNLHLSKLRKRLMELCIMRYVCASFNFLC